MDIADTRKCNLFNLQMLARFLNVQVPGSNCAGMQATATIYLLDAAGTAFTV
jgi:hypothetical protein